MRKEGAYGDRLQEAMRMEMAPALVTRVLRKADVAVTQCRSERPDQDISGSIPAEDAYLVGLQLRDYPEHDYWEGDRQYARRDVRVGQILLYDLKRDPRFFINKPFHSIHFYLPRKALDALSDESRAPRVGELNYEPGLGMDDPVIRNLGQSLLAAFERPEQISRLFMDHIALATATHVAQTYGGLQSAPQRVKGGLAGWQERRACGMLESSLDGDVAIKDIADECGLSTSHFARAFRESTGLAPHQWLLSRRVENAKLLMQDRRLPLSEIALSSGFADQSHFTRVFSRLVGVSPGQWRRSCEIEAVHEQ
jgi:AraC-like DNA-binding protein